MNLDALRPALFAVFALVTGCAASAESSTDDVAVSVDTTADTQQTREHILLARQVGVTETTSWETPTTIALPNCPRGTVVKCDADGLCHCGD